MTDRTAFDASLEKTRAVKSSTVRKEPEMSEVTPWFHPDEQMPWETGCYLSRPAGLVHALDDGAMTYWAGHGWYWCTGERCVLQHREWRGLSSDPSKRKGGV